MTELSSGEMIPGEVIIRGITRQGSLFRPSDWADRLASILSQVGHDHRLRYSTQLFPVTREGVRCVVIQRILEAEDPRMFKFLLDFADSNELEVLPGRQTKRPFTCPLPNSEQAIR